MLWNVRSIANNLKVHFVPQTLKDSNIDIACITETWLDPEQGHNHSIGIIESYGFTLSHTPRKNRKGGGVAFLLRSNINFTPIKRYANYNLLEWHGIRIFGNITSYRLLCIYRKQEISMKIFLEEFAHFLLSFCSSTTDEIVILGDFNVHFESEDKNSTDLADLLHQYGLSQTVKEPTRISGHTLDLIFSNPYSLPLLTNVSKDLVATTNSQIKFDHFPISFSLPDEFEVKSSPGHSFKYQKSFRKIDQIDLGSFLGSLGNTLSAAFENSDNTFSQQLDLYNNSLVSTLDIYAPLQTKTVIPSFKTEHPPWMDTEYRKERSIRRKYEKQWKRYGTAAFKESYVKQRDHCVSLANSKIKTYYSNLTASTDNQSTLFKKVSKLWNKKKTKALPEGYSNFHEMANDFNSFFSNKIQEIRDSLISDDTDFEPSELPGNHSTLTTLDVFEPTTLEELEQIALEMEIKTSHDDPLPAPLLKSSLSTLLPYIEQLVNLSLSTGNIDGLLKESVINPILKKVYLDKNNKKNYRPIVNLQFLSKMIEKVVLKRLTHHMSINNLHCPNQFGYKKHHSTESMLLQIVNDVLVGFEQKSGTILVLLDMSSAFDTVDLNKLLSILENKMNIHGIALRWFRSFLLGRKQKVLINGHLSNILLTLYGVPQGSVLGPVLFNIYVSNLPSFIEEHGFMSSLYADDTNARMKFALQFQLFNISVKVPNLIEEVGKWMTNHFLKINPNKTEIIFFSPPSMKSVPTIQGVFVNDSCIRFSTSVKLLGVCFDSALSFDCHVCKLVAECWYHLKNIAKIRRYLTTQEAKKVVHAVISSKFDYCNVILYGLKQSTLNKLQSVQNEAARLINSNFISISDQTFQELHWLKIKERIVFKILLLVHKYFVGNAASYFSDLLLVKNSSKRLLHICFMDTVSGRRAFSYASPRLWNQLPEDVRLQNDTDKFKNMIKTVLFRNTNNIMQAVEMYN